MDGPMNSSARNNKDNINIHVTQDDEEEEEDDDVSEESGWTAILEDFSCSNNNGSFISSPSLVSDAAWYGPDNNFGHVKQLNFKNMKKNKNNNHLKYSRDDVDLEDTASSPVNSPKLSTLKQMEVNYPRIDEEAAAGNFLGNRGRRGGSTSFTDPIQTEEKNEKIVDLRKRGLCVVPMSMFINYFG